jgi:hypothetical protein
MGSGMGCIVACTCVRDSHKDRVGICDLTVCPGDRIGRERYRFLAVVDEEAFVEAPKGRRNCWKAKLAPRREGALIVPRHFSRYTIVISSFAGSSDGSP